MGHVRRHCFYRNRRQKAPEKLCHGSVCRYSLKFCKKNVICSNSTQKLLVQKKEFCDVSLQVGRFNVLCVERSSL